MATPKVFISSTCYDLNILRSQLRGFVSNLGYEPVMSDYADILFDPRSHTHTSCVKEVENCDLLILIIGSRFGGRAIPKALEELDFDVLKEVSLSPEFMENAENLSITQLEVLKAIEKEIPIFTFIDNNVHHDHLVYEKNKANPTVIESITFPSIDQPETAVYIFNFINFLRHRNQNNSITSFNRLEDIEIYLQKQWSGLFQRLLYDYRNKLLEEKRMDYLSNQIADIKTALMTSISSSDLKETARGAIKYRRLIEFVNELSNGDADILKQNIQWEDLLNNLNVQNIIDSKFITNFADHEKEIAPRNINTIIILKDKSYFESRVSTRFLMDAARHWEEFRKLNEDAKQAIISAILDDSNRPGMRFLFKNINKPLDDLNLSEEQFQKIKEFELDFKSKESINQR